MLFRPNFENPMPISFLQASDTIPLPWWSTESQYPGKLNQGYLNLTRLHCREFPEDNTLYQNISLTYLCWFWVPVYIYKSTCTNQHESHIERIPTKQSKFQRLLLLYITSTQFYKLFCVANTPDWDYMQNIKINRFFTNNLDVKGSDLVLSAQGSHVLRCCLFLSIREYSSLASSSFKHRM